MQKKLMVNGYTLRYDNFLEVWHVSHLEIGACFASFVLLEEAVDHARKG